MLIAILLLASAVASAEDRDLLFLQHLTPGHIEFVSVVEQGDAAVVRAEGMGASTLRRSAVASATEFTELWDLANSPDLAGYRISPGDSANMADPKFFTVSVRTGGSLDFYLKIPVDGHNDSADAFVTRLQRYMHQ